MDNEVPEPLSFLFKGKGSGSINFKRNMNKYFPLNKDNTLDVNYVIEEVVSMQKEMFPGGNIESTQSFFRDIQGLFESPIHFSSKSETGYHSFEHTLQATLCFVRLIYNRHFLKIEPVLTEEKFLIGLAAILMHDVGFLKDAGDAGSSGAKYTFAHETRSCRYGRQYLQEKNWCPVDILSVEMLIGCTGPRSVISKISFLDSLDEAMGYCLCTADYLGQMSDSCYLDKLYILYKEFEESDNFFDIPSERRRYKSAYDLIRKTPGFWLFVLNEKLIKDCKSAYKFLSYPYPDGPNPYLESIESNISKIQNLINENIFFSSSPL